MVAVHSHADFHPGHKSHDVDSPPPRVPGVGSAGYCHDVDRRRDGGHAWDPSRQHLVGTPLGTLGSHRRRCRRVRGSDPQLGVMDRDALPRSRRRHGLAAAGETLDGLTATGHSRSQAPDRPSAVRQGSATLLRHPGSHSCDVVR